MYLIAIVVLILLLVYLSMRDRSSQRESPYSMVRDYQRRQPQRGLVFDYGSGIVREPPQRIQYVQGTYSNQYQLPHRW